MRALSKKIALEGHMPDSRAALFMVLTAASFAFAYSAVFSRLVSVWWNNSVYSHGFLVPLISLYLVWIRRESIREIPPAPSFRAGLPVLLFGVVLLIAGDAGAVSLVQEASIIVTVMGLILLVLGRRHFALLWFPAAYLVFMIRFFEVFTDRLHGMFQNLSANLSTRLLHMIGIPAYRDSVYIELPSITLEVAEVCSGVNYLIAVLAIGIPLAYMTMRSWKRRIVLVAGAVIIAILSNSLRVALIGTLAHYDLAGDLHGPGHVLQAMFTSFVGFAALFAGAWLLGDKVRRREARPERPGKISTGGSRVIISVGAALVIMTAAGAYMRFYRPLPVPPGSLASLPYSIGGWTGEDAEASTVFSSLGVDDELVRIYSSPDGRRVRLYIGYYRTQAQDKELINYLSADLHAGAERLEIDTPVGVVRANRMNGEAAGPTIFWYDLGDRAIADRHRAKLATALNRIVERRTNGAVVMVTDLGPGPAGEREHAELFVKDLSPRLSSVLPGGDRR